MFGKYAIRSLFSYESSEEFQYTPIPNVKMIPAMQAKIIDRVFIKQRYIWRLNNHRILAQASQEFCENNSF